MFSRVLGKLPGSLHVVLVRKHGDKREEIRTYAISIFIHFISFSLVVSPSYFAPFRRFPISSLLHGFGAHSLRSCVSRFLGTFLGLSLCDRALGISSSTRGPRSRSCGGLTTLRTRSWLLVPLYPRYLGMFRSLHANTRHFSKNTQRRTREIALTRSRLDFFLRFILLFVAFYPCFARRVTLVH